MFYELLLPVLGITALVFIYRAMAAPPEYAGLVVLGGAATAFWLNVMWSMATQFAWEKMSANLELFTMAPCGLLPVLAGMALGAMVNTATRALAIVAFGVWGLGVKLDWQHWPQALVVLVLALVALYGMGMAGASLFLLWGREAWHIVHFLQEPVYLLSGFYFPVVSLGTLLALASSLLPLTLALDALRQLLFPGVFAALAGVGTEMAVLAVLAVVFPWVAVRALRHMERLAREHGRLSLRWQ